MRVNDVIITSAAGMNVSSVSRMTICSGAESAPTPSIWTATLLGSRRRGRGWAAGATLSRHNGRHEHEDRGDDRNRERTISTCHEGLGPASPAAASA